jgi:hypothetical protein
MIDRRSSIGIAVLVSWCVGGGIPHALGQPPEQPTATIANPLEAQSLDRLSATRDRPLFSPNRRPTPPPPPPPPEQPPVAVVPQPPNLTLVGIVVDDEGARALIRSSATRPTVFRSAMTSADGRSPRSRDGAWFFRSMAGSRRSHCSAATTPILLSNLRATPANAPAPNISQPTESQSPPPRRRRRQ